MAKIESPQLVRRDFLVQAAQAFAGVGSAMALWPLIDQMNPNRASPAPEVKDVDLTAMWPAPLKRYRFD
jgi:ubiquinol-cytochrome c reductase iron-sulfur subunit